MTSYIEIYKKRGEIGTYFSNAKRKPRIWNDYLYNEKVLNFGSGDVNAANHQEIKNIFRNVFSCDSDVSSGADYKNINEIDTKFDLVICEQVFEHIKIEDFINGFAKKIFDICNQKSNLIITLPNIYNVGTFFSDFDHKNFSPPIDLAAIFCCNGFQIKEVYKWSKINHMVAQQQFNDTEKYLSFFLEKHYGLEIDRYITMVFEKNG